MTDYVHCRRCGIVIDTSIAVKQGDEWYCSDKCYEIHKAYQDGYQDGYEQGNQ